jgi:AraC family transcriptional regulator, regulatory protein of adaptative response / methylated-DNA-[protein]-cysteine methyltransferase
MNQRYKEAAERPSRRTHAADPVVSQLPSRFFAGATGSNEPSPIGIGDAMPALLDFAECDRARLARDPAYDGRFFTGVRTTGVYCRPVCPVRPARSANVGYYPSAAAAEAAGFRPCLRCRPETAPFCPAWNGSRTTVDRAMRLIEEGALDGEGSSVDGLAARVGIGPRHLARLFAKHVQASPSQVAKTIRVQRAKRLLDTTDLPVAEIALQAGFASLRRFNTVFAEVYGRPPTEIRRRGPNIRTGNAHISAWKSRITSSSASQWQNVLRGELANRQSNKFQRPRYEK